MAKALTLRGAATVLSLNGQKVGYVTAFSYDVDYGKRAIYGIDSPLPQELAPGPQRVTGTMAVVRISGSGGPEGGGLVAPQAFAMGGDGSGVLSEKYIHILLTDRINGMTVFEAERATITRQSWSVSAKGLMTGSLAFEAFYHMNEAAR